MDDVIAVITVMGFIFLIAIFLFFAINTILEAYHYSFSLGNDVTIIFVLLNGIVLVLYGSLLNQQDSEVKI